VPCWSAEEASSDEGKDRIIVILQPLMLYLAQICLHGQEASTYFSENAAPLVPFWFDTQVRLMLRAGGTMTKGLPNLAPYTSILGMMRILLNVCMMFGIMLYVCRVLHVVRHPVLKYLHE